MTDDDLDFTKIDLDDERRRRAAAREGRDPNGVPLRVGGTQVATLPNEFPLDVLAPLRELDEEITIVLRTMMNAWRGNSAAQVDAADLILSVIAVNPSLPTTLLDMLRDMTVKFVGQEGYDALIAARLSREDFAFLIGRVSKFYGLSLGESSVASDTATGATGEPSNQTSPASTPDSTPAESGETPAPPITSDSPAS